MYIFLGIFAFLIVIILAGSFVCYRMTFSVPKKYKREPEEMIRGAAYEAMRDKIISLVGKARELEYEDVYIPIDRRGKKKLHARYYHTAFGAPVQIMFHGYRSHPLLDFSGGLRLAVESGFNVLLVDQRAHGQSYGKCLTFGVKECFDCRRWIDYANERCGTKIVLVGISMGAATVMMASDLHLPDNVAGIIADCGYTSPRAIITKVMGEIGYPKWLYIFVRLGAMIYGGFDPDAKTAPRSLAETDIPVLFIHGEADDFVPCDMSRLNFSVCASDKTLLTIKNAGHGLCYMEDPEAYRQAIAKFLGKVI